MFSVESDQRSKQLNILAQNNNLLFPKPVFSTKIKAFFA